MADWVKLYTNLFDNPKIQMLNNLPEGDSYICLWIRLLCLAGNINNGGHVYVAENVAYTPQLLAAVTRKPIELVEKILDTFKMLKMIEVDEQEIIFICGWEEHQNAAGLERIREQTKERVRQHRERKKKNEQANCNTDCNVTCNVTSNASNNLGNVTVTQENRLDKNRLDKNNLPSISPLLKNVTQVYEQKIGLMNGKIAEQLASLLEQYGEDRVIKGIEIAYERGARTIGYIAKCVECPMPERSRAQEMPF